MKLRLIFASALAAASVLYADVIIKNDGQSITAYDIEVGSKSVMYNEKQNDDASSRRIPISEVFAIKIGDGPITPIGQASAAPAAQTEAPAQQTVQGEVKPATAADNTELIAAYNKETPYNPKKQPGKSTNDILVYYSVGEESILSTDDVEISIEPYRDHYIFDPEYRIAIRNKTNHPIYIDLGNTFRTFATGVSEPWFDGTTITQTSGQSSGGSLGLGAVAGALGVGGVVGTLANGVSVGGGSSNAITTTTGTQRIMAIGPNSKDYLPGHPRVVDKKNIVTDYEALYPGNLTRKNKVEWNIRKWHLMTFDRDHSPVTLAFHITVYPTADMTSYYTLPINLYARAIYGVPGFTSPEIGEDTTNPWVVKDFDHLIVAKKYEWY